MVAPRLGTQSRLFPARGRAWGPSPDRCLGDDSLGSLSPGQGFSQAVALTSKLGFKREFLPVGRVGCSE